jgi:uncharacterized cupin superfamily protein
MTNPSFGALNKMLASMTPDTPPKNIDSGDPQTTFNELFANEKMESGVWGCSIGGWTIKSMSVDEVMLMLSGRVRITGADGSVTELSEGDMFYLPKGWSGRWDTLEDMQKLYVIVY